MKTIKLYNTGTTPVIWARTKKSGTLVIQAGKSEDVPDNISTELLRKYSQLTDLDPNVKKKTTKKETKKKAD